MSTCLISTGAQCCCVGFQEDRMTHAAPPFDRELVPMLATRPTGPTIDVEQMIRRRSAPQVPATEELLAARDVVCEDRIVPGLERDMAITVSIFKKQTHVPGGPGVYQIHGG